MTTSPPSASGPDAILAATLHWLEKAVIGLNLCPFAKAVQRKSQIRSVVCPADTAEDLLVALADELRLLHESAAERIDTTLLIHPFVLQDFYDYNAFLPRAAQQLKRFGLRGEVQIASFHPDYVFADCEPDAVENFTNRSPYPMLHLLREASVERAVAAYPDPLAIPGRNIDTLHALGPEGWRRLDVGL